MLRRMAATMPSGSRFPDFRPNHLTPDLDRAFRNFYQTCEADPTLIETYRGPLPVDLQRASDTYFDGLPTTDGLLAEQGLDRYLENFLPLWQASGKRNRALWSATLRTIVSWEQRSGRTFPKTTLFYHWAESHLIHGDVDRGFILMSRSNEEEQRVSGTAARRSPAAAFLRLDDQEPTDLRGLSYDMVQFVRRRLDLYATQRHGQLTYVELRTKFLDVEGTRFADVRLFFAHAVFKLMKLRLIHQLNDIADHHLAPMIFTSAIASFLLVVDRAFKEALYPRGRMTASFLDHLEALKGLGPHEAYRYRNRIGNSRLFDENFNNVLGVLLDGRYRDERGESLEPLERDVVLAYRLRNYSAHSVKSQRVLWERFPEVLQPLFNSFFLAVEKL